MSETDNKYRESRPIVFFDGFCNLCSSSVQFILKHERSDYYFFASLQSDFVRNNFPEIYQADKDPDSLVLFENQIFYFRSDAALRISRELKSPYNLLQYLRYIPSFMRDPLYNLVARNRYRYFGKRKSYYKPDKEASYRFLDKSQPQSGYFKKYSSE